jgi:alcohol dehydrogenase (cytochrome c)
MMRLSVAGALIVLTLAAGLAVSAQEKPSGAAQSRPPASAQEKSFTPVTDEMLWKPSPNDWLSWRRTLDSWGYSPLNEVNRNNVSRLKMAWTRGIVSARTQEATPLVYNGVMYIPNPGDVIMAMDARTGDLKWEYKRKYPAGVNGGTNRNMAIWGNTLIDAGADNSLYAVDARTGEQVWETQILKAGLRANASSGPIIANGKVITGRHHHRARCADGQRGLAHAHDPASRGAG